MKYAIIENGKVVNIAVAVEPLNENWVPAENASIGDLWDGEEFARAPEPPVTNELVNSERLRRREAGTVVQVTGTNGIRLQGRDEDLANLQGLAFAAQLRLAQGDTTHQTKFRDMDNVDHTLVPAQVLEMWSLGSTWVSQVYEVSWDLKDANPIPLDYADEKYWP